MEARKEEKLDFKGTSTEDKCKKIFDEIINTIGMDIPTEIFEREVENLGKIAGCRRQSCETSTEFSNRFDGSVTR